MLGVEVPEVLPCAFTAWSSLLLVLLFTVFAVIMAPPAEAAAADWTTAAGSSSAAAVARCGGPGRSLDESSGRLMLPVADGPASGSDDREWG
jgi:hypothetical protein